MDLSLDRVKQLFLLLPAYTRPTIHVAGTNGKGSVTAILSSVFTSSHVSVGRFNSPHLIDVWDCITVNGHAISQGKYRSVKENVERIDREHSIKATSFEILTATAAQVFEEVYVSVAIFEVGLGGKLDATNALPDHTILISAITSVDLDHQQFLGNTPAAIARVKAGISRPGKVCVLASQKHPEVESAVQDVVSAAGGSMIRAIDVTYYEPSEHSAPSTLSSQSVTAPFEAWNTNVYLELPLLGAHQLQNLATALTILSILISRHETSDMGGVFELITPSTLRAGVLKSRWPGRLEYVNLLDPPLTLLVDGAHNPASAAALQSYLTSVGGSQLSQHARPARTFVLGLSHSPPKTPLETLTPLLQSGDRVALVHFSDVEGMPWVKNAPFSEMKGAVRTLIETGEMQEFERDADDSSLEPLRRALRWADSAASKDTVVLAGSLYLVADLFRLARRQGVF